MQWSIIGHTGFVGLLSYSSLNIAKQLRTPLIVEFDEKQAIFSIAMHVQFHSLAEKFRRIPRLILAETERFSSFFIMIDVAICCSTNRKLKG